MLLLGDPGTAKSQLLKFVEKVSMFSLLLVVHYDMGAKLKVPLSRIESVSAAILIKVC